MIYSNDESDKSIRRKNYLVTVYFIPLAIATGIAGILYFLFIKNYILRQDLVSGLTLVLTPALLVFGFNKKQWLKMPDGTYHNIKGIQIRPNYSSIEPAEYDEEFYNSTLSKVTLLFIGVLLVTVSLWLGYKAKGTKLIPLTTAISGLVVTWFGIKNAMDKTAKLKLAKKGLWTPKLGFIEWKHISKTQIVEDTNSDSKQKILEIYLKGTIFAEANQFDERLTITNLSNKEFIDTIIQNLSKNSNEIRS